MATGIIFLGSGGGRHSTIYQTRSTGGFLMRHGGSMLHVDPGPGALSNMNRIRYDPALTESLIVSHCHPDHYSDAEVVIEGMCKGGCVHRGSVYGSPTVIEGSGGLGPCLSEYHRGLPGKVAVFRPGDILDIDGMRTDIMQAKHSDPTNVGFMFHTPDGAVSYVSDTEYSDEIADQYLGSRVLILPVTTPDENRIRFHLCTEDAIRFSERVEPEVAVFTHLGMVMIRVGPERQAALAESRTGIRTVAADDLMTLEIGREIVFGAM